VNTSIYGELSLHGVYLPTLLALMGLAYVLKSAVRFVLGKTSFYAWVWHPALFNFAIYVLALSGVMAFVLGASRD